MNHQQNEEPLVSETESQYEVQVGFKLVILLPQSHVQVSATMLSPRVRNLSLFLTRTVDYEDIGWQLNGDSKFIVS